MRIIKRISWGNKIALEILNWRCFFNFLNFMEIFKFIYIHLILLRVFGSDLSWRLTLYDNLLIFWIIVNSIQILILLPIVFLKFLMLIHVNLMIIFERRKIAAVIHWRSWFDRPLISPYILYVSILLLVERIFSFFAEQLYLLYLAVGQISQSIGDIIKLNIKICSLLHYLYYNKFRSLIKKLMKNWNGKSLLIIRLVIWRQGNCIEWCLLFNINFIPNDR